MANLIQLIENLEANLFEYVMDKEEQGRVIKQVQSLGLQKDHLNALKYLVMGRHINTPRQAVPAREIEKVFTRGVLAQLAFHKLIKGDSRKGYYTTMDGFLIGTAVQRRYIKAHHCS